MRASGTRIDVPDLDSVPTMACGFCIGNKDFLQLHAVRQYLQRPDVRHRLRRIAPHSIMFDRDFRFTEIDREVSKLPTATPFLKRGILSSSKTVISQSLAFSRMRFTRETLEKVFDKYPDLEADVVRYCARVKVSSPVVTPPVEIQQFETRFTTKKAFIRQMYQTAHTIDRMVLEFYRVF
jgi:hypothetical protein